MNFPRFGWAGDLFARVVYIGTQDLEFQDFIFRVPTQFYTSSGLHFPQRVGWWGDPRSPGTASLWPHGDIPRLLWAPQTSCHLAPISCVLRTPVLVSAAQDVLATREEGWPPRRRTPWVPGKGRIRSKIWSGAWMKRFASVPPPKS